MSVEQNKGVLEAELGGVPIEEVFEWIDLENVLGSASIAQASQILLLWWDMDSMAFIACRSIFHLPI